MVLACPTPFMTAVGQSMNLDSKPHEIVSSENWTSQRPEDRLETERNVNIDKVSHFGDMELCVVCGDRASGRHYGAISCEGCKGFFKRSIRKQLGYQCRGNQDCEVTKHHRNRCQFCRLQKCLMMGMRSDSVQSERKSMDVKKEHCNSSGNSSPTSTTVSSVLNSNSKIYVRKDLSSSASVNLSYNFQDRVNSMIEAGVLGNSNAGADLNTLATVANSLSGLSTFPPSSSPCQNESDSNGETKQSTGLTPAEKQEIVKAFDNVTRVVEGGVNGCSTVTEGDNDSDTVFEMEGSLLTDDHATFNLTTPSPMPSFLNIHFICETASRLLFLSVHWARSIPAFQLLNSDTQVGLLRGCWTQLFALGMAQCAQVMNLNTIFTAIVSHLQTSIAQDKVSGHRVKQVIEHMCKLQDFVNSMVKLQVEDHEYAYLKALVLFSTDNPSLPCRRQVDKFQEKGFQEFRSYIDSSFPEDNDRFPRLLLRIPPLHALQPGVMEEVFFAGLIGNVQIDSVIPYILKMETAEYNGAANCKEEAEEHYSSE